MARRPASCTRAFPYSPTVARFDPASGYPRITGFPDGLFTNPASEKRSYLARHQRLSAAFLPPKELFRYSVGVFLAIAKNPTVIILGFHPRDSGSSPDFFFFCFFLRARPRAFWGLCARRGACLGLGGWFVCVCVWARVRVSAGW